MNIYTIGHSNHSAHEFLELLIAHDIECLVDVRSFGSHQPQFSNQLFPLIVRSAGIKYERIRQLGGFKRQENPDSINKAWRHPSFRNYADYMQTRRFKEALLKLMIIARFHKTAYCCAESLWWRCHRRLISDALVVRGVVVEHIMGIDKLEQHKLTDFAVVEGKTITYPKVDES